MEEIKEPRMIHYNSAALLGMDVTDQEVCMTLNLPLSYANTPEINNAALEVVFRRNINDMMEGGMTKEEANREAIRLRKDAQKLNAKLRKNLKV